MPMKRSSIKPGKGFAPRAAVLKSNAFARTERKEKAASSKAARGMKTRQLAVTADEKAMWDRLAQLGCVACMKDGHYNPHVSIHHCDGRTKPGCHGLVLPLCGPHHQDDGSGAIAIHPWKARFEKRYGTQEELMAMCQELLKSGPSKAATLPGPIKKSMENILSTNMISEQDRALAIDEAQS